VGGGKPCKKKWMIIAVSFLMEGLHDLSPLGKGKVVPVHIMKVYWRSGGIAPHILNLDSRWTFSFIDI
jgi:hypothetical protein